MKKIWGIYSRINTALLLIWDNEIAKGLNTKNPVDTYRLVNYAKSFEQRFS